jgi:hypothetical protein
MRNENTNFRFTKEENPFATSTASIHKVNASRTIDERTRSIQLVAKRFETENEADVAVHVFDMLKDIGIKILPKTYRRNPNDSREIIMTDFNSKNRTTISTNSYQLSILSGAKSVDSFNDDDLKSALKKLREAVVLLGNSKLFVPPFAYFFSRDKAGGRGVGFGIALADLENIEKDKDDASVQQSILKNAKYARDFISSCMRFELRKAPETERVRVEAEIEKWYTDLIENVADNTDQLGNESATAA